MDRLIVVVLVPVFVEIEEGFLQDLVDGRFPTSGRTHTHESMAYQLSLVQLDHLTNLQRCYIRESVAPL